MNAVIIALQFACLALFFLYMLRELLFPRHSQDVEVSVSVIRDGVPQVIPGVNGVIVDTRKEAEVKE